MTAGIRNSGERAARPGSLALVLLMSALALLVSACRSTREAVEVAGDSKPSAAEPAGLEHPLLERLIGEWVLRGPIGGEQVVHDVRVDWVLGRRYLRIHELARERDEEGEPAYEAIVFIGWDTPNARYTCLWLDSTSGEGLSEAYRDSVGHAVIAGDALPFLFRFPDGSPWHTTFTYDHDADTWTWHMVGEDETAEPFADVRLVRSSS